MISRRFSVLAVFLLMAAGGQWGCSSISSAPEKKPVNDPPPLLSVRALPVRLQDWAVTAPVSGSLRSRSVVDIKAEVGGKLTAVHFEEGDHVRRGEVLAEIDTANYELAVNQARAALGVAEAGLDRAKVAEEHARREKERADNLLRTGGITEKDHLAAVTGVKETESQVRLAEAQCAEVRAALEIARKALRDCRITAPGDGSVYRKFLDAGSLAGPGTAVYTLVDNRRLELDCLLPSYRLSEVRPGQRVLFTTPSWGERRFEGKVASISPMVESDNRSVTINVSVGNPKGELRSGMFARGEIEVGLERAVPVIPRSALVGEQTGSSSGIVYVVGQGRAKRRSVTIGGIREDLLWVREGLSEGETVVVEIGPSLSDGAAVRVTGD